MGKARCPGVHHFVLAQHVQLIHGAMNGFQSFTTGRGHDILHGLVTAVVLKQKCGPVPNHADHGPFHGIFNNLVQIVHGFVNDPRKLADCDRFMGCTVDGHPVDVGGEDNPRISPGIGHTRFRNTVHHG